MTAATSARRDRQKEIVASFPSRQYGKLLTVNLSPIENKVCSFNCSYCCTGSTMIRKRVLAPEDTYSWEEVVCALEEQFPKHAGGGYDGICVAGTGEPTICPYFVEFTDFLIKLRDEHFPKSEIILYSNCSRIGEAEIRAAVARYDIKMCKLDAGDEDTFRRVNLPARGLTLDSIVAGLTQLEGVTLHTGIVEGEKGNLKSLMGPGFVSAVKRIRPLRIDLYEFDRPALKGKRALRDFRCSVDSLNAVAEYLEANLDFAVHINVTRREKSRGKHPLLVDFRPGYSEI